MDMLEVLLELIRLNNFGFKPVELLFIKKTGLLSPVFIFNLSG